MTTSYLKHNLKNTFNASTVPLSTLSDSELHHNTIKWTEYIRQKNIYAFGYSPFLFVDNFLEGELNLKIKAVFGNNSSLHGKIKSWRVLFLRCQSKPQAKQIMKV